MWPGGHRLPMDAVLPRIKTHLTSAEQDGSSGNKL